MADRAAAMAVQKKRNPPVSSAGADEFLKKQSDDRTKAGLSQSAKDRLADIQKKAEAGRQAQRAKSAQAVSARKGGTMAKQAAMPSVMNEAKASPLSYNPTSDAKPVTTKDRGDNTRIAKMAAKPTAPKAVSTSKMAKPAAKKMSAGEASNRPMPGTFKQEYNPAIKKEPVRGGAKISRADYSGKMVLSTDRNNGKPKR